MNAIPVSSIAEIRILAIWLWALGANRPGAAVGSWLCGRGHAGAPRHALRCGLSVRVLESDAVSAPMTCGLFRPVILLPAAARGWRPVVLQHLLLHELAPARCRDASTLLLANIVRCLYRFHPLAWLAASMKIAFILSGITLAELRYGIEGLATGKKRKRLDSWLEPDMRLRFERRILRIDSTVADACGKLVARREGGAAASWKPWMLSSLPRPIFIG